MVDTERSCSPLNGERCLRLTVIGLGLIVATAMLSHGWGELRVSSGDDDRSLQNAASGLILAGVIMALGALRCPCRMGVWRRGAGAERHGTA
jgi:hypothetical protein